MLVVHIVGAVANPGVYRVPGGSRAEDVINMAGGLTEDADGGSLNLAARVIDGQQVVVRTKAAGGIERPAVDPKGKINLNLATTAELDGLPGVGPALAQRIVERRQRSGPYEAIEQLRDERILPAPTYERVKELLTVD